MRVLFSFPNLMFVTKIEEEDQIYDYMNDKNPFGLIFELFDADFNLEIWDYNNKNRPDGIVSTDGSGKFYAEDKVFKSITDALLYLWSKHTHFKVGKLYRFIYNGGTRKGIKRAVKVTTVSPTLINCIDLDTGDIKNYSFSKMKDIEEIK